MNIPQPVINTFKRVGIVWEYWNDPKFDSVKVPYENWITGEPVQVHPLIRECIKWVYQTQLMYENGQCSINISDFDRIRHFILKVDSHAYMTCID